MENLGESETRALIQLIKPIADDEWIVGHRGSEWLALTPDLEEDLAFSSISQDEMGHAQFYYELLHSLGLPSADELVYLRPASDWTNAHVLETPNRDWAHTVALRYLYEVLDDIRHEALLGSWYQPLTDGVRKIRMEEKYHLQHFTTGFQLLATGTELSRQRLIEGIADIWPRLSDLFAWGGSEEFLEKLGLPNLAQSQLKHSWTIRMEKTFHDLELPWPGPVPGVKVNGRNGEHTQDLSDLLDVMTEVHQIDVSSPW
ncbi:MAG: phenylacetate-CoA oxygenase subunit PaaC [Firmicutes bacterium]|nr:phenylacetate-CoA oxygenase subunit PaaC [Bacillota bacterium]